MEPTVENQVVDERESQPTPSKGVSRMVVALVGVGALVIGGLVGGAIGWKIEQERVKDDVKNIRPIGTVVAVTDDSITVNLRTGSGQRVYALTDATVVDKAESGATSDIDEGSTVFLRTRRADNGDLEAAQVVVLPDEDEASGQ